MHRVATGRKADVSGGDRDRYICHTVSFKNRPAIGLDDIVDKYMVKTGACVGGGVVVDHNRQRPTDGCGLLPGTANRRGGGLPHTLVDEVSGDQANTHQ